MKRYLPYLPALILIVGALIRAAGYGSSALWFDESITLARAQHPFLDMFLPGHSDQSGALLLDLLLRPLVRISPTVWVLRLPSLLASFASLVMVWLIMRRLKFNLTQQVVTAALVAFLPSLIWMSQDARSYSLLTCFYLVGFWAILEGRWWVMLGSMLVMEYLHVTAPIYIGALFLAAVVSRPWEWRRMLWMISITMVAFVPQAWLMNLGTSTVQANSNLPEPTLLWMLANTLQAFWIGVALKPFEILISILGILFSGMGILFFGCSSRSQGGIFLLMFTVLFLGFILLSFIRNIFVYRAIIPMVVFYLLWFGYEVGLDQHYRNQRLIIGACLVGMVLIAALRFDPSARGGRIDQAADQIRQQWQSGDVIRYTTETVGIPMNYYLSDLPHRYTPIGSSPYLNNNGGGYLESDVPAGYQSERVWLIYPEDAMLSPGEMQILDAITAHHNPWRTLTFPQTSSWKIYLVDAYKKGEQHD